MFGLTTELIVGSAPPEKAGAASGISETAAELGGALGIAVLGSVGVAIYRGQLAAGLPAGLPPEAAAAARDTLGAALGVAERFPGPTGDALIQVSNTAFVAGLQLTSAIAAGIAVVIAVVAGVMLRKHGAAGSSDAVQDEPDAPSVRAEAVEPEWLDAPARFDPCRDRELATADC